MQSHKDFFFGVSSKDTFRNSFGFFGCNSFRIILGSPRRISSLNLPGLPSRTSFINTSRDSVRDYFRGFFGNSSRILSGIPLDSGVDLLILPGFLSMIPQSLFLDSSRDAFKVCSRNSLRDTSRGFFRYFSWDSYWILSGIHDFFMDSFLQGFHLESLQ